VQRDEAIARGLNERHFMRGEKRADRSRDRSLASLGVLQLQEFTVTIAAPMAFDDSSEVRRMASARSPVAGVECDLRLERRKRDIARDRNCSRLHRLGQSPRALTDAARRENP
jgi:hypothetical protein